MSSDDKDSHTTSQKKLGLGAFSQLIDEGGDEVVARELLWRVFPLELLGHEGPLSDEDERLLREHWEAVKPRNAIYNSDHYVAFIRFLLAEQGLNWFGLLRPDWKIRVKYMKELITNSNFSEAEVLDQVFPNRFKRPGSAFIDKQNSSDSETTD